ncbi:MAG: tRNA (adenosine(37)-N6)-threonylcarbamoyltransferase complex ATPase subunit type 1 TsaE [Candidatus Paceibacterota bacterium]
MKKVSKSLTETKTLAEIFIKKLKPSQQARVVTLVGDLGSGKTTFAQAIAKSLGIKVKITSPTFIIEKKYKIPILKNNSKPFLSIYKQLIHIDAYRLSGGRDLLALDWIEIVKNPQNLILLEWPEIVSTILPSDRLEVKFKFIDDTKREISFV